MAKPMSNQIIGRGWSFPISIGRYGGISLSSANDEIQQAIRIILTTAPGERVMRPTFGSRLHELVFAPINPETMATAQRYVEEALKMWEPRIRLVEVRVYPDHNTLPGMLLIELDYEIKATNDRRSLVYPFYLIPEE